MKNLKEIKREEFMFFDKFDVKEFCDKEEFLHFSIDVFNNSRITKKFNFNTQKT